MATHVLKTWPQFFGVVSSHAKQFEIRKNDRDYQVGDTLVLREWTPEAGFSGRERTARVTYIAYAENLTDIGLKGLLPGYCVMSLY